MGPEHSDVSDSELVYKVYKAESTGRNKMKSDSWGSIRKLLGSVCTGKRLKDRAARHAAGEAASGNAVTRSSGSAAGCGAAGRRSHAAFK